MNKRKVRKRQHDITDCGAACLASVASHHGLDMPIARIRQYASTDEKGTTVLGMIEAAGKLGFSAKGVRGDFENLPGIPLPAIAHMLVRNTLYHFTVIYRITGSFIEVMDPADGRFRRIPAGDFKEQWTGVLILLAPDASFQQKDEQVSVSRRLRFLLKPHWPVLMQALFGAAVYTLTGLSTAIFVQLIVDHVLPEANAGLLNLMGAGMIVLLSLRIFIQTVKTVFILKTGQLIDARLILGYYKHLLKLPQQFFDTMRVGEIISRIGDAVKIRAFINDTAIHLAVNLFILLFSFGLMFTYYWKLGIMMSLMIPVWLIIWLITNQFNKRTQRSMMEHAADLESQLVESLHSISTIKQFGLEETANLKTERRFVSLLKSVYRSGLNSVFSGNASEFTSGLFTILLLWTGARFVMEGTLTAGELLSFYTIVGYFTGPVSELIGMNKSIQDAVIAADRLFEIMDLEKENEEEKVVLKPPLQKQIFFNNVSFKYGTQAHVFKDLTLKIPGGKITAITGESGSGKTTIINILQKLYPLDTGKVIIGDLNIDHIDTDSLRELTGVVPQKIHLFTGSVVHNIAVGEFHPDMDRVISISRDLGILDFIEQLPNGFHTVLGENGGSLSGGEKQRIAIARALYKKPEILLLDEATSSLDPVSENYVQNSIRSFRNMNKTVIIIAHRLSTVLNADMICVLKNGRLAESGTHDELMKRDNHYFALWKEQFPLLDSKRLQYVLGACRT